LGSGLSWSRLRQEVARHGGNHGLEEPPFAVNRDEADLVEHGGIVDGCSEVAARRLV
jgi:hypothetical protein